MSTPQTQSASAVPATEADRRRSPRQNFTADAWISEPVGSGGSAATSRVVVIDLSLNGVGFTSDQPFQPDASHWFVLDYGNLRASSRIRVVTCQKTESGQYQVGAEFQ